MHVFHVFKKHVRIPKPHYTAEMRKAFKTWDKSIISQNGHVNESTLILPESRQIEVDIKRTDGIIIQDIICYSGAKEEIQIKREAERMNFPKWFYENQLKQNPEFFCFNRGTSNWTFELFSLQKSESGGFELHLNYTANQFYIGAPKRNNYKLYNLEKGKPIEVTINGKSDSTMSSGTQRTYEEFDFIIEYIGDIKSVKFFAQNKLEIERPVPTVIEKKIDLRKILY